MKHTAKNTASFRILKWVWSTLKRLQSAIFRRIRLLLFWWRFRIRESHRKKHTYIVAGTGAGKSELLKSLIWQHLIYGKTAIVVIDPNGDFAEQVAKFSKKFGKEMVYLDPTLSNELFPIINPLYLPNLSTETLDKVVQQMHKTLMQSFKELDIKLTGAMDGMLYNMIHTLYRKEGSSLLDLVRFVDDTQNQALVKLGAQTDNYVIRDYFENKFMQPWTGVTKQGLANRLNNFLGAESLQRLITGKTTIDLAKSIKQKKLIVFNLSKGKLGVKTSKLYGRFVLTTLLNIMLARADVPAPFRTPCHFYVDEFHNYVSDTIEETFAEGRKYKVYLTVATQNVGQGVSAEMKTNILWNVNVKIIGKAGYESRDMMLKQMGFNAEEERILKFRQSFIPKPFRRRAVTVRAFKKMKVGRFIVQVDNYYPSMVKNRRKLLSNKRSMSNKKREKVKAQQLEKYYSPAFKFEPKPITSKDLIYNPFETDGKAFFSDHQNGNLGSKLDQMNKRSFRTNL